VTTALAASCKITKGAMCGTILADEGPFPLSSTEWIVLRPADEVNTYLVQAVSVNPSNRMHVASDKLPYNDTK
jgi:hypothetical protein